MMGRDSGTSCEGGVTILVIASVLFKSLATLFFFGVIMAGGNIDYGNKLVYMIGAWFYLVSCMAWIPRAFDQLFIKYSPILRSIFAYIRLLPYLFIVIVLINMLFIAHMEKDTPILAMLSMIFIIILVPSYLVSNNIMYKSNSYYKNNPIDLLDPSIIRVYLIDLKVVVAGLYLTTVMLPSGIIWPGLGGLFTIAVMVGADMFHTHLEHDSVTTETILNFSPPYMAAKNIGSMYSVQIVSYTIVYLFTQLF
jgi:hypothetical protein